MLAAGLHVPAQLMPGAPLSQDAASQHSMAGLGLQCSRQHWRQWAGGCWGRGCLEAAVSPVSALPTQARFGLG